MPDFIPSWRIYAHVVDMAGAKYIMDYTVPGERYGGAETPEAAADYALTHYFTTRHGLRWLENGWRLLHLDVCPEPAVVRFEVQPTARPEYERQPTQ